VWCFCVCRVGRSKIGTVQITFPSSGMCVSSMTLLGFCWCVWRCSNVSTLATTASLSFSSDNSAALQKLRFFHKSYARKEERCGFQGFLCLLDLAYYASSERLQSFCLKPFFCIRYLPPSWSLGWRQHSVLIFSCALNLSDRKRFLYRACVVSV
jgi:hypothetical protein